MKYLQRLAVLGGITSLFLFGSLSAEAANLQKYLVTKVLDSSDEIIVEDKYGDLYLVEYGIGCLSMWRYEDKYIYIDVGGSFLDGISDTIYLFDSDDDCRVWDADEIEGSTTYVPSYPIPSVITPSDFTAPNVDAATAGVFSDSTKNTRISWEESTDPTPFFEWSGITDASGVLGYYAYFGSDKSTSPQARGIAGPQPSYAATATEGYGTYYLIIQAIDKVGNLSSPIYWTYILVQPVTAPVVVPAPIPTQILPVVNDVPEQLLQFDKTKHDSALQSRLKGMILLQTQSHGEAWYINPVDGLRYYLRDGSVAYGMMRSFGLGITDKDLQTIPMVSSAEEMKKSTSACRSSMIGNRLKGKILLQVNQRGEAWYVHPEKCRRIYMKDGETAYSMMRFLSLGIANADLVKLPTGDLVQAF